jgi:ubiquinone/menaquinone biosynthesis C-methylase UbiE
VSLVPQEAFASAVPYYAEFRTGYPQQLVDELATRLRLDGSQAVLDVGCGTGQIAIPIACHASTVMAIDPLSAMLARGRAAAQAAGVGNIRWIAGDSEHLATIVEPGAHLAVFAASFHWTNRSQTLDTLDRILAANGSIVVITDDLDDSEQPDWDQAITEIRSRYLEPRIEAQKYLDPSQSHLEVLQRSPFSVVQEMSWSWSRQLSIDQVVGLQFSYSFSTPAVFGDKADAFAQDVRDAVHALYPDGTVTEPFRNQVLIATRP